MTQLEILKEKLGKDVETIKDDMARGTAKSFDEFRQQVGIVQGINRCLSLVHDLEKAALESEFNDK